MIRPNCKHAAGTCLHPRTGNSLGDRPIMGRGDTDLMFVMFQPLSGANPPQTRTGEFAKARTCRSGRTRGTGRALRVCGTAST